MSDEDRWAKLEELLRRVIGEELDARGVKAKTKIGFVGGRWTGITADQLSAWRAAYGSVDIEQDLLRAAAHLMSNPQKNPKNCARFLNAWLARSQDRFSIRSIPTRNEPPPMPKTCSYCERPSTCAPNRIPACDDHSLKAMDQEPVKAA